MKSCLKVALTIVVVISIGAIHFQPAVAAENNFSVKPLIFCWIWKPPYVKPPANGSSDKMVQGIIREGLERYITIECGWHHAIHPTHYEMDSIELSSEFEMMELLRQNKVQVAVPIFEHPMSQQYSEFPFFKLDDYPGTKFITTEDDSSALSVVLDAVLKAWPLLAVTMVLTAIAGIIMWALVSFKCNTLGQLSQYFRPAILEVIRERSRSQPGLCVGI